MELSLQVGKYDVQKLLGKGASGTVYLAKDTFTGREIALKTIEPEATDAKLWARLVKESGAKAD
jgi:serine/threonine-protein kinase